MTNGKILIKIKKAFEKGNYRYTKHAIEQSINRNISEDEVKEAIASGEIIEEYPENKYSQSCLIYGKTVKGRPLHVQCSLPPKINIVTVYEPEPKQWVDYKIRKRGVRK